MFTRLHRRDPLQLVEGRLYRFAKSIELGTGKTGKREVKIQEIGAHQMALHGWKRERNITVDAILRAKAKGQGNLTLHRGKRRNLPHDLMRAGCKCQRESTYARLRYW